MRDTFTVMARTKKKSGGNPAKKAAAADDQFADSEDFPEANTIADLKEAKASGAPAKPKPTKKQPTLKDEWDFAAKLRFRWGTKGAKTLAFIVRAVLFVVTFFVIWLVALGIASSMVPNIVSMVSESSGLTLEDRLDLVLVGWVLPAMFLLGLLFVATCALFWWIWRVHLRLGNRFKAYVLGE